MRPQSTVLLLDLGEPVKIADLARDLIRLAKHTQEEIPIVFSVLRPGAKLFEELLAAADDTLPTPAPRLRVARLDRQAGTLSEVLSPAQRSGSLFDDEVQVGSIFDEGGCLIGQRV